jgi:ATP-binding protein involved in chromosome partitioning
MLGVHQRRQRRESYVPIARLEGVSGRVEPMERYGLKLMSIGLLMGEDQVINPPPDAVGQVVVQTLRDVAWGGLDILLLDLPPSAGQPQEDLLRFVAMSGVVIVTTPQDLSLLDAGRSLRQFQRAGVPILGIVENMSYFICPDCGERHEVFQRSEQWQSPALDGVPLLGRIPLTPLISQSINRAHPLVHEQPESVQAGAFSEIAATLGERLSAQ